MDTCIQVTTGDQAKRDIGPSLLPGESTRGSTPKPRGFSSRGRNLKEDTTGSLESVSPKRRQVFFKSLIVTALEIQSICSILQVPFPEWNFIIKIKTDQDGKMENLIATKLSEAERKVGETLIED